MNILNTIALVVSFITCIMCILWLNFYKVMFGDARCDEGNGCPGAPGTFSQTSSFMSSLTVFLLIINAIYTAFN